MISHYSYYGNRKNPSYLVVLLHGYGSNGDDLISLAPEFEGAITNAVFMSPNAIEPFEGGYPDAFQWFSLQDRNPKTMYTNSLKAQAALNNFIDTQLAIFGLDDSKLILMGFSQGAYLTILTALDRKKAPLAAISYSGFLTDDVQMAKNINSRPPLLLTHGSVDQVVPSASFELLKEFLKKNGLQFEAHIDPYLAHGISSACIAASKKFLEVVVRSNVV